MVLITGGVALPGGAEGERHIALHLSCSEAVSMYMGRLPQPNKRSR